MNPSAAWALVLVGAAWWACLVSGATNPVLNGAVAPQPSPLPGPPPQKSADGTFFQNCTSVYVPLPQNITQEILSLNVSFSQCGVMGDNAIYLCAAESCVPETVSLSGCQALISGPNDAQIKGDGKILPTALQCDAFMVPPPAQVTNPKDLNQGALCVTKNKYYICDPQRSSGGKGCGACVALPPTK